MVKVEFIIPTATDPLALFDSWLAEARAIEQPPDPLIASFATVTPSGDPAVRLMRMIEFRHGELLFRSYSDTPKGRDIAAHPAVALSFQWRKSGRNVRINGVTRPITAIEADAAWAAMPRPVQVSTAGRAIISRAVAGIDEIMARIEACDREFPGEVPRPECWGGWWITPLLIEFWCSHEQMLHERVEFSRTGAAGSWAVRRLCA
jgi:pyridoxamine 5'-phosphate oxidase